MKICVTGGAGFIGSHLCERLLRLGHQLQILDDLNDFYSPAEKRSNLEPLVAAGARFDEGDICSPVFCDTALAAFQPEAVIHIAARAGVRPSIEKPLLYEQVNVGGTINLLEACRRQGARKFVFASSSSIYGVANQVPFSEADSFNLPISPYAMTKIAAEKICYTYSYLYGIRTVCTRFFTVYGPRQRPDLAIRKFIDQIDAGRPIPVFGDGSTGRDYTFVGDIVEGLLAALGYDCAYEIFNLGNSSPVLLKDLIAAIEDVLGKKAIVDRRPEQLGDVPITYADIRKAQAMLGYHPRTLLRDGLAQQAEWLRARRSA